MSAEALPPLVVQLEVAASPAHAFRTWVERAHLWWPRGHTLSGAPTAITFEPWPGGRVVEHAPDGTEHPWGEVVAWQPPRRLELRWHLGFPPEEATSVAITFEPAGAATRVRLEQTGWDALGEAGPPRRERTTAGWAAVTAAYAGHVGHPDPPR